MIPALIPIRVFGAWDDDMAETSLSFIDCTYGTKMLMTTTRLACGVAEEVLALPFWDLLSTSMSLPSLSSHELHPGITCSISSVASNLCCDGRSPVLKLPPDKHIAAFFAISRCPDLVDDYLPIISNISASLPDHCTHAIQSRLLVNMSCVRTRNI